METAREMAEMKKAIRQLQQQVASLTEYQRCRDCQQRRERRHGGKSQHNTQERGVAGAVKWFSHRRAYGFLTTTDGRDIFVHRSALPSQQTRHFQGGAAVIFAVRRTRKGPEATGVRLADDGRNYTAATSSHTHRDGQRRDGQRRIQIQGDGLFSLFSLLNLSGTLLILFIQAIFYLFSNFNAFLYQIFIFLP